MRLGFDDSSFEEPQIEVKRRKRRMSKDKHAKSMRGNPEGDSIHYADVPKLTAPPNSDNDSELDSSFGTTSPPKKRKTFKSPAAMMQPPQKYNMRKPDPVYDDTDISALDQTDTPDSLSMISAIPDASMMTTFNRGGRKQPANFDMTLEKAVQRARGQPDGAEKSFHKKASRQSFLKAMPIYEEVREAAEGGASGTDTSKTSQETSADSVKLMPPPSALPLLQRKKSVKVN